MVFEVYSPKPGILLVRYFGKEFEARIYQCWKKNKDVDAELQDLGLAPDLPVALIPSKLIESDVQLIQGVAHYYMNKNLLTRIRHKGLLLATLVTGFKQLKDLLENLRVSYSQSERYFIVAATGGFPRPPNCSDYEIHETDFAKDITNIVKNVAVVLDLL
ncbi:hypothetical protein TCELL_0267 [Thermogladius calderae 1633]|uniref:Uncharacterized protein n=1 Tax=Thermogladius calderae (strain DSM 22663 / VKM B-2946 / 1633) TaxID=1184251 RepID=I3TD54_THEC1|nr:hypothetical protein [Thermogladius calderae]AFK50692.1 hypothetical protein TCELL_0267 [Thermogladius calderae 1633]